MSGDQITAAIAMGAFLGSLLGFFMSEALDEPEHISESPFAFASSFLFVIAVVASLVLEFRVLIDVAGGIG